VIADRRPTTDSPIGAVRARHPSLAALSGCAGEDGPTEEARPQPALLKS